MAAAVPATSQPAASARHSAWCSGQWRRWQLTLWCTRPRASEQRRHAKSPHGTRSRNTNHCRCLPIPHLQYHTELSLQRPHFCKMGRYAARQVAQACNPFSPSSLLWKGMAGSGRRVSSIQGWLGTLERAAPHDQLDGTSWIADIRIRAGKLDRSAPSVLSFES